MIGFYTLSNFYNTLFDKFKENSLHLSYFLHKLDLMYQMHKMFITGTPSVHNYNLLLLEDVCGFQLQTYQAQNKIYFYASLRVRKTHHSLWIPYLFLFLFFFSCLLIGLTCVKRTTQRVLCQCQQNATQET